MNRDQQREYVRIATLKQPSFKGSPQNAVLTYGAECYSGLPTASPDVDKPDAMVREALVDPWFRKRFPHVATIAVVTRPHKPGAKYVGSANPRTDSLILDTPTSFYVVLHELAHFAAGLPLGHHRHFRRALVLLVGRHWNADGAARLLRSFKEFGLAVG